MALLATLLAVGLNEINRSYLNDPTPYRYGMIATADEPSYLVPPANYTHTGEWKDNSNGITAYFQRSPGYGMIYLPCLAFGNHSLLVLKWIHLLLFFLSILLFRSLLEEWGVSQRRQWITTVFYAFLPCYSGFLYYPLTEGVLPFFVIWAAWQWTKATNGNIQIWGLVSSTGMLLLIRPQFALLVVAVLIAALLGRNKKMLLWLVVSCFPLLLWYVRTGLISGEVPALHPIYSKTNNHLYRPTHEALTDLFRVWEWRSDVFHNQTGRVAYGDSLEVAKVIGELPAAYRSDVGPLLHRFHTLNELRERHFKDREIMDFLEGEECFVKDVYVVRKQLIAQHRMDFYGYTPLRSAVEMLTLSHLNLYVFQAPWRGKWWMETIRLLVFVVITLTITLTALLLFLRPVISLQYALAIGMFAFLFYLFFVQRLNEDRYIYPLLPVFLALAAMVPTLRRRSYTLKE